MFHTDSGGVIQQVEPGMVGACEITNLLVGQSHYSLLEWAERFGHDSTDVEEVVVKITPAVFQVIPADLFA